MKEENEAISRDNQDYMIGKERGQNNNKQNN